MPAEFNPYPPTKQKPHHIPLKQSLTDNIFPFSQNNIPVELRKKPTSAVFLSTSSLSPTGSKYDFGYISKVGGSQKVNFFLGYICTQNYQGKKIRRQATVLWDRELAEWVWHGDNRLTNHIMLSILHCTHKNAKYLVAC